MKSATMTSQIDNLLSTVFQSNMPSESSIECVDRLLTAFKEVGQAAQHTAHSFGTLMATEDWQEN